MAVLNHGSKKYKCDQRPFVILPLTCCFFLVRVGIMSLAGNMFDESAHGPLGPLENSFFYTSVPQKGQAKLKKLVISDFIETLRSTYSKGLV